MSKAVISTAGIILLTIVAITGIFDYVFAAPPSVQEKIVQARGKQVTVSVGKFEPPLTVNRIDKSKAVYVSPEMSALSQISAMTNKDHSWWLETWTSAARDHLVQRDKELSRSSAYWINRWKLLDGQVPEIRYWCEYTLQEKKYVLIGYGIKDFLIGDREYESTLAFSLEGGRWLGTQDLAADPVFNNALVIWHSEGSVIYLP